MTMTREAKNSHTEQLITAAAEGYTKVEFAAPLLRRKARADRGHCRMTAIEYAGLRMNRGTMHEGRIDLAIEVRRTLHRAQRIIGGRRITGRQPGSKRLAIWATGLSEARKITRK